MSSNVRPVQNALITGGLADLRRTDGQRYYTVRE